MVLNLGVTPPSRTCSNFQGGASPILFYQHFGVFLQDFDTAVTHLLELYYNADFRINLQRKLHNLRAFCFELNAIKYSVDIRLVTH